MPCGSELQTAGAATLKPLEAKVVRTRGADNRRQTTGVCRAHADSVWCRLSWSISSIFQRKFTLSVRRSLK